MTVLIKGSERHITSRRVLWRDGDRDVWSWRTDAGEPPLTFESTEAAQAWIDEIAVGMTATELRDIAGYFHIEEVT